MTLATALLKHQFPNLGGLQSTLVAQKNMFSPVLADIDCIQIHHTGQFHRVTSSAAVMTQLTCMTTNLAGSTFLKSASPVGPYL